MEPDINKTQKIPSKGRVLVETDRLKFDDLLVQLGEFGPYQKWQYVLATLPTVLAGCQMVISVFIAAAPLSRCSLPGWENDTYELQDSFHHLYVNLTIPSFPGHDPVYDKCELYTSPGDTNSSTVQCTNWVYDKTTFHSTIVSDFDLVCEKVTYRSHTTMIFMLGFLFGSVTMGMVSDILGRKICLCTAVTAQAASGVAIAFSPEFYSFCALRFTNGFANAAIALGSFVIITEIVGPTKRRWTGALASYFFTLGFLLLAGLAYLIRDWKYLQIACSAPGALLISYWWILSESPRWLLVKGRREEARVVLQKIATANRTLLTKEMFENTTVENGQDVRSLALIFRSPVLVFRMAVVFFNWMVVSMMYFGLYLNSGNLAGNLYLNYFLNSLVEVPCNAILLIASSRIGRRPLVSFSMMIGGMSCVSTLFTVLYAGKSLQWITVALAVVGKGCANIAFMGIYIVTSEVFPTVIRNAAFGGGSLCARIGGMVAPYIADLGEHVEGKVGQAVPLVTFGVSAVIAGALVLLLPETFRRKLPETIQDSIDLGRTRNHADEGLGRSHGGCLDV